MDAVIVQAKKFFQDGNFVVLDTETTGKDPETAEIVEIAILDHAGAVLLNTLVKPLLSIPHDVVALHGITDAMVADAPPFPEIFPQIREALEGKIAIVYNANYDLCLLESLVNRYDLGYWTCNVSWCLMNRYAAYRKTPGRYGNYKWHKLSEACAQQRVVLGNAHRALGDAQAAYALLKALSEK